MNRTVFNVTYSRPSPVISQLYFLVVHQTVVMTVSLLGNLFLLFVIFRGNHVMKRRVSPVQLLIIHTCVADLLFALLSLGTEILTLLTYPNYYGSNFICKFMRYVQMFPMYASPFLLVAISADRYQAICRPLAHFRSSRYRRPNWMAAIAWGLALLLSAPQFIVWGKNPKTGKCSTIYGANRNTLKNVYVIMFNTLAWLLPSIFAAIFYCEDTVSAKLFVCPPPNLYVLWIARRKTGNPPRKILKNSLRSMISLFSVRLLKTTSKSSERSPKGSGNKCPNSTENGFRQVIAQTKVIFNSSRNFSVRLTITIVACNFFLWMPFCVINVVQALWPEILHSMFYTYVAILGNLNSCLNPWIYILFNRSHVKKALCQTRQSFSEPTTKRSFENFECSSSATMNNNNNRSNAKHKQVQQRSYSTDCTSLRTTSN
ncbi:hypothetical protein CAEBREN_02589 [Caenorhabditis brenneri]|uniref:G-protein coupled receptors family 1 profile domain-containing protein n=1 Tax=Caenorhabditis brenneri TaxID=135651 RepID=G0MB41_CAEBE|nr:hypothetical protein CAEBREN_02589 [Caenorhabditis brenneri]